MRDRWLKDSYIPDPWQTEMSERRDVPNSRQSRQGPVRHTPVQYEVRTTRYNTHVGTVQQSRDVTKSERYQNLGRYMILACTVPPGVRPYTVRDWCDIVLFCIDYGTQCWIDFPEPWHWKLYMTLIAITLFLLPAICIATCYTVIVRYIYPVIQLLQTWIE